MPAAMAAAEPLLANAAASRQGDVVIELEQMDGAVECVPVETICL
jgi:hypothetical protein